MNKRVVRYSFSVEDLGLTSDELRALSSTTLSTTAESGRYLAETMRELDPTTISGDADTIESDIERGSIVIENPSADLVKPFRCTKAEKLRISVHTLGQAEFCGRAAVISHETGDQRDLDEVPIRLTYLPNFSVERIEERLGILLRALIISVALIVSFAFTSVRAAAYENRAVFFPVFALLLASCYAALSLLPAIFILSQRRLAALHARQNEPEIHVESLQTVNWWSMLKSGFEPVNYESPFRHPELALEGSPWRVLERGDLRIPVIRSGARKLGDHPRSVFPKHSIRLAAYAALLETTTYARAPYGIVLPSNSPHGFAIPITGRLRTQMISRLQDAINVVQCSQQGLAEPRIPVSNQRCLKCPLGKPVPIAKREINEKRATSEPLLLLEHVSGRKAHCLCADRFGTVPPHEQIVGKRFRPFS